VVASGVPAVAGAGLSRAASDGNVVFPHFYHYDLHICSIDLMIHTSPPDAFTPP
jgi:hypothetical protein